MPECPCCGYDPDAPKIRFDLATGYVHHSGKSAYLTPKEAQIFGLLARNRGRIFSKEILIASLYRTDADWPDLKVFDAFICKMRTKLRRIYAGDVIETLWGCGWRYTGPDTEIVDSSADDPYDERKSA